MECFSFKNKKMNLFASAQTSMKAFPRSKDILYSQNVNLITNAVISLGIFKFFIIFVWMKHNNTLPKIQKYLLLKTQVFLLLMTQEHKLLKFSITRTTTLTEGSWRSSEIFCNRVSNLQRINNQLEVHVNVGSAKVCVLIFSVATIFLPSVLKTCWTYFLNAITFFHEKTQHIVTFEVRTMIQTGSGEVNSHVTTIKLWRSLFHTC